MSLPNEIEGLRCSLLLFVATPAEEKGLREAALARGLPWEKRRGRIDSFEEEYFWLGPVGDETGVLVFAPARASGDVMMGSTGLRGSTRARHGPTPLVLV